MRREVLLLIARQFWTSVFKSSTIYLLLGLMAVLLFYATYSGVQYHDQNHFREDHQEMARESWEANPDKHPHRMAHFGTFAFRTKHPLSVFDFGIENFTGNAVFLEAHRQNTVNFSEASLSTSLIRFGELSMAMILQLILPLIIFFTGFSAVVADRESGTLKILLTQGASWKEILYGKSLGLCSLAVLFCLPYLMVIAVVLITEGHISSDTWMRLSMIGLVYVLYLVTLSFVTIIVSVSSRSSKTALVKLLGIWLLLIVILPRTAQSVGGYLYPTPTKLEFRTEIEEEVVQFGDSHDPDDPYYEFLRDSVLAVYKVESIDELPFNYGGYQSLIGEKISTEIYQRHHAELMDQYQRQNGLTLWLAVVDPYLAVKNLSMVLSGSDLTSYENFQLQTEDYRYQLAQRMNELQMEYIKANVASSEGSVNVVSKKEWTDFPDFSYKHPTIDEALTGQTISVVSIVLWLLLVFGVMNYWSKKASAI